MGDALASLVGVSSLVFSVLSQIEVFGILSRRGLLPRALSRKLSHVCAGATATTVLPFFPSHYWPVRLAFAAIFVGFIAAFSIVAHAPEATLHSLPPALLRRVQHLGACSPRRDLTRFRSEQLAATS